MGLGDVWGLGEEQHVVMHEGVSKIVVRFLLHKSLDINLVDFFRLGVIKSAFLQQYSRSVTLISLYSVAQ